MTAPARSRTRRVVEACVFVLFWMFVGVASMIFVGGGSTTYVLVGIPLTVLFQRFVRREPLRALWIRDAPRPALGGRGWAIAALLMLVPGWYLVDALIRERAAGAVWNAVVLLGAPGAAGAMVALGRGGAPVLGRCAAICAGIAVAFAALVLAIWPGARVPLSSLSPLGIAWSTVQRLVYYVPVCFVLEEVTFRGALDAHVHHPGEGREWASALLVSFLWALWHLPLFLGKRDPSWLALGWLAIGYPALGVCLSMGWRRSGNLLVPAAGHAVFRAIGDLFGLVG